MLNRYRLPIFFTLAFLLSWYPWLLAKFGVPTSGGINPLGPLAAGLLLTALTEGKKGVGEFLRRIVRWRVAPHWYLAIFLIPAFTCAVSAGINVMMGAPLPTFESIRNVSGLPAQFLFTLLFVGLGEEPGWRGYALEQMQKKRSAFLSTCILAVFWAAWHIPLMGAEFAPQVIPAFLVSVFAGTIVLTWIYNGANKSVLLPMIFHAAVNTIGAGYVFRMFAGSDQVQFWYIYSSLWLIVSLVIAHFKMQPLFSVRKPAISAISA